MVRLLAVVLLVSACKTDKPPQDASKVAHAPETVPEAPSSAVPAEEPAPKPGCQLTHFDFSKYAAMRMPDKKPKGRKEWDAATDRGVRLPGGCTASMYLSGDPYDGYEAGVHLSSGPTNIALEPAVGFTESPGPTIVDMAMADLDGDGKTEIVVHYEADMVFPSEPPTGMWPEDHLAVVAMPEAKLALDHSGGRCKTWSVSAGQCEGNSKLVVTCNDNSTEYSRAADAIEYAAVYPDK
jgi:hypothetical protein